jgi:hypothetical protein
MNDRRGRRNGQKNESRAVGPEIKLLCGERQAESVEKRMEDSNLIRPGGKTVDPEFPKGISDGRGLRSLNQHLGARQKTPVEAIDDDAGNLGCSHLWGRDWYRNSFLLCAQFPAREEKSEG